MRTAIGVLGTSFGRIVFGGASLALGVAGLTLHDQLASNWTLAGDGAFLVVSSIALIAGGMASIVPSTRAAGAAVLAATYAIFAATFVPPIVAQPRVYASWGNVFYQVAPAVAALAAFVRLGRESTSASTLRRATVVTFGVCSASFAIEQVEFFARTSSLVPAWIPPSGPFWTSATTLAFALAAVALITGYRARLAAYLEAAMLLAFVPTIWIPLLIADPRSHGNWSEAIGTLVIGGAAWTIATASHSRVTVLERHGR